MSRRWDYCRIDGRPLEYAAGKSSAPNDALATFIPNRFESTLLLPGPTNIFSLGTWVDAYRGVTTAKEGYLEWSKCFAGTPVETLSGCAQMCLEEGAPSASTMSGEANMTYECVAFAYNRALHLCVRLPEFATDAEFGPHLSEWSGEGWQNFVSKYHGRDTKAVCPSKVLARIRESGYKIVRDKNNGHLYVQCANSESVQKVSCIESDCQYKSSWCFVKNSCRSGVPSFMGGCTRLSDVEALACAGEHGAVAPSNGNGQISDYWDASNAVSRCARANTIRAIKVAVATPFLLAIGEFATVSLVQNGVYAELVGNVFSKTASPIGETLFRIGSYIAEPIASVGEVLPLALLQFVYGAIVGSFALVYVLGSAVLAISPTAAALLLPIVSAFAGAQRLTEVGIDIITRLVGYGHMYPMCCCPEIDGTVSADGTRACAVTASLYANDTTRCPTGWVHDASQCTIPEIVRYSEVQTVSGCRCANFTDCGTNPPHHGHAWCHVSGPGSCGRGGVVRGAVGGRWDFCRVDGRPLDFAAGRSSSTNDALATFLPNEYSRLHLLGPSNPLRPGTWTDPGRAVTTAKAGGVLSLSPRQCFAGLPAETLGGLRAGLPRGGGPERRGHGRPQNTTYPCVGFAYHRALHLCVRLPAFAADARYTPTLRHWGGEGWQNYVSKYYGRSLESSCPALTLLDIRDKGYAVARDKSNGHLYLRCANQSRGRTQKASCIDKECRGGGAGAAPWCFVENSCRWCSRIEDLDPLACGSVA
ncbi:unnamed protein product [Prorocentrum cordatum]|uniref:Uncharacterized protein n=1 Tax=Prorocentrum cordatum TaxID=2364126 RepID=A0ABN9RA62_9DINO|nr:unnamed protein product [Polarella glacialis]